MEKQKPLGMRIGESVFCAGYLAFAAAAGMIFLSRMAGADGALAWEWRACAAMTFLLGAGDAFHLIPRILVNIRGEAGDEEGKRKQAFWLGLGNLISSVTMTVFYIVFFFAVRWKAVGETEGAVLSPDAGETLLLRLMVMFAAVRILLCLFPQNNWFQRGGGGNWHVIRNVPFVAVGILTVVNLLRKYASYGAPFLLLSFLVILSFVCYMAVVLLAGKRPAAGMLMIPKTICYIWIICFFL